MNPISQGVKLNSGGVLTRMTDRQRTSFLGAEDRGPAEQQPGRNLGPTEIAAQLAVLNISQPSASVLKAKFDEAKRTIDAFDVILGSGGTINFDVFSPALVNVVDQNNETLLHHAMRKDNKDVIDHLIEQKYSLTVKNKQGQNPLMLAALCLNNPDIFDALKDCDEYKDAFYAKDANGWTAIKCMRELNQALNKAALAQRMKEGAGEKSPEDYDDEFNQTLSLLKAVIGEEFKDLVESLPLNYRDGHQNTLLHYAAGSNNVAAVRILLESGYDILLKNKSDATPLMLAVANGSIDSITLMGDLQQFGGAVNQCDRNGFTPLMYACMVGGHDVEIRQQMIVQLFTYAREKEVNIDHVNFQFTPHLGGNTLLQWVALELKNQQVLEVLLANPKLDIKAKNTSGQNIVMKAAAHGDLALVGQLSDKTGFDQAMAEPDRNGWSAIHYTTLSFLGENKRGETLEHRKEIAQLLIQKNSALKTFTINDGRTAVQLAAEPELKTVLS